MPRAGAGGREGSRTGKGGHKSFDFYMGPKKKGAVGCEHLPRLRMGVLLPSVGFFFSVFLFFSWNVGGCITTMRAVGLTCLGCLGPRLLCGGAIGVEGEGADGELT